MSKASKRRAWLRWLVLAVLGLAVAAWLAYPRLVGPRVTVVSASSGPLVQSIVTYGRVRPPARVTLAPLVTGRVAALTADVGDEVTAGQVLLRLDDSEAQAALASAQGQIDDASAQGKQVRTVSTKDAKESVERARTRVDEARRTHGRI
ncbi:MAG: biotin/lipoyl-binding protein, partial [Nannocystaceae bacterium]